MDLEKIFLNLLQLLHVKGVVQNRKVCCRFNMGQSMSLCEWQPKLSMSVTLTF